MPDTLAMPFSAFQLRDAVRQARRFDSARLDRVLRLDADRGLVEVQASASWSGLAAYLHPNAPAKQAPWAAMPGIGESLAGNVAGPDGRPVVGYVESLALVTPDGELRRVSRHSHPDLFALAIGGQGLFGAPYSATLRLAELARAASEASPAEELMLAPGGGESRPLHVLVPPRNTEPFLVEARARCGEWRLAIEGVRVRQTLAESETALPWARRDYAAITLRVAERDTIGGAVRATQLRRELIDTAISHGGGYPIASTPEATRAQAEACYPQLKSVLAEKRRLDPADKLANEWLRHHRSLLGREACDVRWAK
jgi:hypothetical protein